MKTLVVLLVLGVALAAEAAQCPKTCTRQERYYTACGIFNWGRCARYRTVSYTCYQTCVHGGWTDYAVQVEGPCSATCGGGVKTVTYSRSCTNPAPYNGGNDCVGETGKTETQSCNPQPCPVDGGWTDFTQWTDLDECSSLCGGGKKNQTHSRTCTNPAPAYGGKACVGALKENRTIACNEDACGDKCPEDKPTYITNSNNPSRYFHCDNGVAVLRECQPNTRWDQDVQTCVHEQDAPATPLKQGDKCGPESYYALPKCTQYIVCANNYAWVLNCPPGTLFDFERKMCDFEANVSCP